MKCPHAATISLDQVRVMVRVMSRLMAGWARIVIKSSARVSRVITAVGQQSAVMVRNGYGDISVVVARDRNGDGDISIVVARA